MVKIVFSGFQEQFIRDNYLKMSRKDMAKKFGFDPGVISRFMVKEGLTVPKEVSNGFRSAKAKRPFTPQEDQYIRDNIQTMSIKQLAKKMKKTQAYISSRAKLLGYGELISQRILDSRIKKGTVPPNKGKKQSEYMSPEAIARTAETRFKKGNLPHNCFHEVGRISVRNDKRGTPYKHICVRIGVWVPLHTHIWEQEYGKLPKGHCLWFKNGDTLNCTLENLELITRAENLERNNLSDHGVASKMARLTGARGQVDRELKDYLVENAPDLVELKRQQLILQREIKNQRNDKNADRK